MLSTRWVSLVVFFAAVSHGFAFDPISVGIRAGVPLTDVLPDEDQAFATEMRRFTVGPVLEVDLLLGLAVEFDALYKRFDHSGPSVMPGQTAMERASSWEFAVLGKYRPGIPLVRPYVEAGVTFNRLSGFLVPFQTDPSPPSAQPTDTEMRTGIVTGVGLEFSLPAVRIIPGIRYSHWGKELSLPSTNLIDFQVGILF